jgi:transcriptional regulator with XRE-family HTH domain
MPNGRALSRARWKEARAELRAARKACGITVEALAGMVGATPKAVSEVLRPSGRMPSRPLFYDLCFALRATNAGSLMLPTGWRMLCPTEGADLDRLRSRLAKAEVVICALVTALQAAGVPLPEGLDISLR